MLRGKVLRSKVLRTAAFLLLGIVLLSGVSTIMVRRAADSRIYNWFGSFYEQKQDSLDAVYLGSSVTYSSWIPPLAWEQYGITVSSLTCPAQPFLATEYLIREARKTQPDAIYIIPIQTNEEPSDVAVHYVADNMPLSWNKIQFVRQIGEYKGLNLEEQMEYLFPIIRYHSRWTGLTEKDFFAPADGFNGASHYTSFLRTSKNVSSSYRATDRITALPEKLEIALDSLLEYCDAEQVKVLFVQSMAVRTNEYALAEMNAIKAIVEANGYPVLSLLPTVEEIGLNVAKDYYSAHHTNIHGAVKVTDYLSRYLVENYSLADKRGDPAYSSWDEAYENYTAEYASAYTLDVEWNGEPRDSTLAAPKLSEVAVRGTSLTVSWDAVPEAGGYQVYRKTALGKSWQAIGAVDGDVLSYTDTGRKAGSTYYYTVIAYREEGGVRYWGDYDFAGITGEALLNAPKLLSLKGTENNLTLTWKAVKGADGYNVYRKIPSKSWVQIGSIEGGTSYTDTEMLTDMPYQYTARAYYYEEDGKTKTLSSYDTTGLLYTPDLKLPTLGAAEEDGAILLTWERIEGIQGCTVYRRTQDSDWEQLTTQNLSSGSTSFRDITAQAGIRCAYRVEAYIRVGNQERVYELETGPEWIEINQSVYDTSMPEITCAEQAHNQIYVAWEAVDGASYYELLRRSKTEDGGWSEWDSIKSSITTDYYWDAPPEEDAEFEYLVRSYFEYDGLTYYGQFDKEAGYGAAYLIAAE